MYGRVIAYTDNARYHTAGACKANGKSLLPNKINSSASSHTYGK